MQTAISAGHSPHEKLERLRLSDMPRDTLYHFGEFIAWRIAFDIYKRRSSRQQDIAKNPRHPRSTGRTLVFRNLLYDLAANSCNLPKLGLLLDISSVVSLQPPLGLLHRRIDQGLLKENPKEGFRGVALKHRLHSAQSFEAARHTLLLTRLTRARKLRNGCPN